MTKVEIKLYLKDDGISRVDDESQRTKKINEGVDIILGKLLMISKTFPSFRKDTAWYFTGESKKEAMEKTAITEGRLSENAHALACRDLMSDFPGVTEKIWNDHEDTIMCNNYIQSDFSNFSYWIVMKLDNEEEALSSISSMLMEIVSNISPRIIRVETNNYSLDENHVFPDRLPVGWMFYTNKIYSEDFPGLKEKMSTVTKAGEPIGTLFFSKKGFFDGSNKDDIKAANDLEIMLASYEILPTYRNIF